MNLRLVAPADQPIAEVTSDLGVTEMVLGLAVPSTTERLYWIGLHETWKWVNRTQITFVDCGLRVYNGQRAEDLVQFLRLEWSAPEEQPDGDIQFKGRHAAHPHWHIDTSALAGQAEYYSFLDSVTSSETTDVEEFGPMTTAGHQRRSERGFEWLKRVHFPAHAGWMANLWSDVSRPGPHQNVPADLESLSCWWTGALLYIEAELRAHG